MKSRLQLKRGRMYTAQQLRVELDMQPKEFARFVKSLPAPELLSGGLGKYWLGEAVMAALRAPRVTVHNSHAALRAEKLK